MQRSQKKHDEWLREGIKCLKSSPLPLILFKSLTFHGNISLEQVLMEACILYLHALIDLNLTRILSAHVAKGDSEIYRKLEEDKGLFGNLYFGEKLQWIKNLKIINTEDKSQQKYYYFLTQLNKIRNAIAHKMSYESDDFKYNNQFVLDAFVFNEFYTEFRYLLGFLKKFDKDIAKVDIWMSLLED